MAEQIFRVVALGNIEATQLQDFLHDYHRNGWDPVFAIGDVIAFKRLPEKEHGGLGWGGESTDIPGDDR